MSRDNRNLKHTLSDRQCRVVVVVVVVVVGGGGSVVLGACVSARPWCVCVSHCVALGLAFRLMTKPVSESGQSRTNLDYMAPIGGVRRSPVDDHRKTIWSETSTCVVGVSGGVSHLSISGRMRKSCDRKSSLLLGGPAHLTSPSVGTAAVAAPAATGHTSPSAACQPAALRLILSPSRFRLRAASSSCRRRRRQTGLAEPSIQRALNKRFDGSNGARADPSWTRSQLASSLTTS
jgi:hypothetical protein